MLKPNKIVLFLMLLLVGCTNAETAQQEEPTITHEQQELDNQEDLVHNEEDVVITEEEYVFHPFITYQNAILDLSVMYPNGWYVNENTADLFSIMVNLEGSYQLGDFTFLNLVNFESRDASKNTLSINVQTLKDYLFDATLLSVDTLNTDLVAMLESEQTNFEIESDYKEETTLTNTDTLELHPDVPNPLTYLITNHLDDNYTLKEILTYEVDAASPLTLTLNYLVTHLEQEYVVESKFIPLTDETDTRLWSVHVMSINESNSVDKLEVLEQALNSLITTLKLETQQTGETNSSDVN